MKLFRLTLVGPESTGKTTLARELAAYFGCRWLEEASRAYAEEKAAPLTFDDVLPIARRHCSAADALPPSRLQIFDTDLVMTCVYSDLYYRQVPAELVTLTQARLADQYLLLEPDVPWIADPVRDMPHRREEIRDRILALLARFGVVPLRISGDWATRRAAAIAAVELALSTFP